MEERAGVIIPWLERRLPSIRGWKGWPLRLLRHHLDDSQGATTDLYVLGSVAGLLTWLALCGLPIRGLNSLPVRIVSVGLLLYRGVELFFFLLQWLFVDRSGLHEKRAFLLSLLNLAELRLAMCLAAVLVGGVPASERFRLLAGISSAAVPWPIMLPYQVLTWLVIAGAIGALAGALRGQHS